MHAIRLHEFGPADNLVLDQLDDLIPEPGEVRIAVEASGVHLLDTTLRRGEPGPMPAPGLPTIPGREVAGVVDQVGVGADRVWLGRRVVAHLGLVPGGYAEQATTAVEKLFVVPDHVGFPEAIAAVGTGRTALGVLELEPPVPGERVLVLSAAGGLGWLLVQGAGWMDRVEALGGVDVVYDGVGGDLGRSALELVKPGGRLVMFGYSAGSPTQFDTADVVARGITVGWSLGPRMVALPGGIPGLAARSLDHVAGGEWAPLVSTYPLGEAARAHAELEGRRALGKVVLTVDR